MQRLFFFFAALLICPLLGSAEIKVVLKLDPTSSIRFETVSASVTILNDTDEEFSFDESDRYNKSHIIFEIERKKGEKLSKIDKKPLVSSLKVDPGEKQEVVIDIVSAYDMATPGRYLVKAVLVTDKVRYESEPVILDVVRGLELSSISKEVPGASSRTRKYTLLSWSRNNSELIFLSVDEDEGSTNYGVFPLGLLIRTFKPILTVDRDGTVTVIHQVNRDYFMRSVFTSDKEGIIFENQTRIDENGKTYVPPAAKKEPKDKNSGMRIPVK